jgi:hypothetical protein
MVVAFGSTDFCFDCAETQVLKRRRKEIRRVYGAIFIIVLVG